MEVTAKQVKELRDRTGVAMMACKKALQEASGDIETAIELLRKRGTAKAAEKAARSTGEGRVALAGRAMVSLGCETDFVAKNESFGKLAQSLADKASAQGADAATAMFDEVKTDKIQEIGENIVLKSIAVLEGGDTLGGYVHSNGKIGVLVALQGGSEEKAKDAAMHAAAMSPEVARPDQVDAALIEKEKEIAREQLTAEGKPENIMDNIIAGKIKKFCAERALVSQAFVKDPSQTVQEYLGNVELVNFVRVEI